MEKNQYITWKGFFYVILALIIAAGAPVCGAIAWGWSETQTDIHNVEVRLVSQVQRIEKKLDNILDYLIHNANE